MKKNRWEFSLPSITRASLLIALCLSISPAFATIVKIKGIDADFHPFVLELLNDIAVRKAPEPLTTRPTACGSDESLSEKMRAPGCALPEKIARALYDTRFNCRRIQEPLDFYRHEAVDTVAFSEMKSVPAMLKAFGKPLTETPLPGALQRADFRRAADSITLKVFADEFAQGLRQRGLALDGFAKALPSARGCAGDLAALTARALQEVSVAEKILANTRAGWIAVGKLPYPTLTAGERKLLAMFLSAMAWRARGGGIYKKVPGMLATQKLRVKYIWNAYGTVLDLLGAGKATSGMSFGLYTRGFKGWHDFWDMGTNDRYTLEEDFRLMTERGRYQVESAVASARSHGFRTAPLEQAGMRMGACYLYGWHAMPAPRPEWGSELAEPFKNFSMGPTSWGELCFGAGLGLGLAETLLPE